VKARAAAGRVPVHPACFHREERCPPDCPPKTRRTTPPRAPNEHELQWKLNSLRGDCQLYTQKVGSSRLSPPTTFSRASRRAVFGRQPKTHPSPQARRAFAPSRRRIYAPTPRSQTKILSLFFSGRQNQSARPRYFLMLPRGGVGPPTPTAASCQPRVRTPARFHDFSGGHRLALAISKNGASEPRYKEKIWQL